MSIHLDGTSLTKQSRSLNSLLDFVAKRSGCPPIAVQNSVHFGQVDYSNFLNKIQWISKPAKSPGGESTNKLIHFL